MNISITGCTLMSSDEPKACAPATPLISAPKSPVLPANRNDNMENLIHSKGYIKLKGGRRYKAMMCGTSPNM